MTTLVHEFADKAAKEWASDFEVVYQLPEKAPAKRSSVYLEGPREFLEHGNIVLTFDEDPKFRPKTWKYDREGKRELTGQRKVFFVRKIFNEIANDTTFYLAYGRFHNARLLTDRPGETFLLKSLTAEEKLAATTTANGVSHACSNTDPCGSPNCDATQDSETTA